MSNREYAVAFKKSQQISPDDWETCYPTLKVNDSTTIGEIREWYRKHFTYGSNLQEDIQMNGLTINQLQEP